MTLSRLEIAAALFLAAALLHGLCGHFFSQLAQRFPRHAGALKLLSEIEAVFALWALLLLAFMALTLGPHQALTYAESRQYTEPMFVFVVMLIAASRPLVDCVMFLSEQVARKLPVLPAVGRVWMGLCVLPLLGSLITEPAAMTIAALMLSPTLFRAHVPEHLKYLALGVLFVNISMGGTLTSFAAPPVLMVANTWGWDSAFMLLHFGWKAALAVGFNATITTYLLRHALKRSPDPQTITFDIPWVITLLHVVALAGVVALAHHPVGFLAVFVMFLGLAKAYPQHQRALMLKEALLVSLFLSGLVVLGGLQSAWLQPLITRLDTLELFLGSALLTAITDNAALTYLGAQITGLSDQAKYSLVAGAVAGGGLTVIANAPNPAGFAILKQGFTHGHISFGKLLLGALPPTAVAMAAFAFF